MATVSSLDLPGLGVLEKLPDSPRRAEFWKGTFRYAEEGYFQQSTFFMCVESGDAPAPAQCDFARRILADIDRCIEAARQLLATRLVDDAGFFGVDAGTSTAWLHANGGLLPFGLPEPTFYEPEAWNLRFAESWLPKCQTYGVAVAFVGTRADHIEDLSDSVEA